ncbi:MAG: hypothetical protein ACP5UI_03980 [Thermoprotei archaeon]|nr:hypothetical protein [TACK group archaeon]
MGQDLWVVWMMVDVDDLSAATLFHHGFFEGGLGQRIDPQISHVNLVSFCLGYLLQVVVVVGEPDGHRVSRDLFGLLYEKC